MSSARKIDRRLVLIALTSLTTVGPLFVNGQQPASPTQELPALQAHLNALQTHAQRQLNALSQQNGARGSAMLEVLANVGKAIQQQVSSSANDSSLIGIRKNEPSNVNVGATQSNSNAIPANYREQGEQLRQEIVRRAGHLQQVVAGTMEALKSSSDLIVRRLLEQLNGRLDQAKSKADKIVNEPATSEVAIRALTTINQGLNNVNNIVTNIVNRLDLAATQPGQLIAASSMAAPSGAQQNPVTASRAGSLLDPNRLRQNLQQLSQQFSSAISAAQQQRLGISQPNVGQQPPQSSGTQR